MWYLNVIVETIRKKCHISSLGISNEKKVKKHCFKLMRGELVSGLLVAGGVGREVCVYLQRFCLLEAVGSREERDLPRSIKGLRRECQPGLSLG